MGRNKTSSAPLEAQTVQVQAVVQHKELSGCVCAVEGRLVGIWIGFGAGGLGDDVVSTAAFVAIWHLIDRYRQK